MKLGDGYLGHFEIKDRAPLQWKLSDSESSYAYAPRNDGCAASTPEPAQLEIAEWYALHSIHDEDDFKDIFHALHFATLLRGQLLNDICDVVPLTSSSTTTRSILRRSSRLHNPHLLQLLSSHYMWDP